MRIRDNVAKAQAERNKAQSRQAEFLEMILPEMRRLSLELHAGQYAPNQAEFEIFADDSMPHRTKLHYAFGPWSDVAAACGMTVAEPGYYYHKAKERQEEWTRLAKEQPERTSRRPSERQQADAAKGLYVRDTPRIDTWRSVKDGKWYTALAWAVI